MATKQQAALKKQLYQNLQNQGFQDELKIQLRTKLIDTLKDKQIISKHQNSQKKALFQRVMSSLLSEELIQSNCQYTNSIFEIQCGYQGQMITRNELIEMMSIRRNQISAQQSILQYIIRRKFPFSQEKLRNAEVQTNPQQIGYTLQQKLMMIDQEYRVALNTKENRNKSNVFDRKKIQLELAQKSKKQLDLFKQFEAHKIKIKVSQQWRKKFQQYSNHLNEQYSRKFDQLRRKDRALNDEYVLKNTELNNKKSEAESLVKQKIELLDMKNQTIQMQMSNLVSKKNEFDEMQNKNSKQLSQKIKNYDNLLLSVNQKIKYQVGLNKLSIQQEYQQKEAESMRRKKVIDEEYGKLMGIKDTVDIIEKQNERLSKQNNLLRQQLTTLQIEFKSSLSQLGNKVERIEMLKDQIISSQDRRKQAQETIKQERAKSKRYESEILMIRRELEDIREQINQHQLHGQAEDSQNESHMSARSGSDFGNESNKRITDIGRRLQMLKHERRKDIQKLKMGGKDE